MHFQLQPFLLINVKQPHIEGEIVKLIREYGLSNFTTIFDFELVGDKEMGMRIKGLDPDIHVLVRASDREIEPLDRAVAHPYADGVWLDTFDHDWISGPMIEGIKVMGKDVYVVSPELHGRSVNVGAWLALSEATGICTDLPHLLEKIVDPVAAEHDKVHPRDPWW